jgi:hypothetical protein
VIAVTVHRQGDCVQGERRVGAKQVEGPKNPLPAVSLPTGGGAIRDIGEKFGVGLATGTGSLTIPLASSPGRSGFGPSLSLSYDSGAGNGPFGFGWRLSTPAITRRTDKGLPRYVDASESDIFLLSGVEDLVPILDAEQRPIALLRTVHGVAYEVHLYRPRIEGLYARVERWLRRADGTSHFRTITRDNVTTLFGLDPNSRVADPDDPTRIFSYLICRTFDDKGNVAIYNYVGDDGQSVDVSQANEANRSDGIRRTQRYLKSIQYDNGAPYFPDWSEEGAEPALPEEWRIRIVFDYGDHHADPPSSVPDGEWPTRVDPFSTYRAGFEVRTYRRCRRALLFHNFPEEKAVGADCLVESTDFTYSDEATPSDPTTPVYTFLQSIAHTGYRRSATGWLRAHARQLRRARDGWRAAIVDADGKRPAIPRPIR